MGIESMQRAVVMQMEQAASAPDGRKHVGVGVAVSLDRWRCSIYKIKETRGYRITGDDGQCGLGAGFWNFDKNKQIE
jgi:hypothetical protein